MRSVARLTVASVARLAWHVDFRGKSRILRSIPLGDGGVFTLPWGKIRLNLRDRIQRQMAFGSYERREIDIASRFLRPGGVAIDVGAHVGFYTLLLGSLVGPEGRVIALEPHPLNYERLRENIALNDYGWCEALRVGASSQRGRARLFSTSKEGESGLASLHAAPDWVEEADVELVPLEDIIASRGIDRIDMVKIDVEGHEFAVLKGLESFLDRAPTLPMILIELVDALQTKAGHQARDIVRWLRAYGYRAYRTRDWSGAWRPNFVFVPGNKEEGWRR